MNRKVNDPIRSPGFRESVLVTTSEGLMVVDPEGTILYFNPAAERITASRREEMIGRRCPLPDEPHRNAAAIREALRGAGGNRTAAVRAHGVSRVTLWKRMRELGLARREGGARGARGRPASGP